MPVANLLEKGLLLFNEGRFYESHEVWEDLWRATADPVLKICHQGLIQAAVGLHHLGRRNHVGARSQIEKAIRNLRTGAPAQHVLDIEGLISQLSVLLEKLPEQAPRDLRIARLK
jgi:predicted metal-dependent hydrolase